LAAGNVEGVFDEERQRRHDQRHGRAVESISQARNPEFFVDEEVFQALPQLRLDLFFGHRHFAAGQGHVEDHRAAQHAVHDSGHTIAQRLGDHWGQGNADDHRHELEGLAHGIGLGPFPIRLEELREERAVVGIDNRIEGTRQHVEEHAVCHQRLSGQKSRRVVKDDECQDQHWRTDHQPRTAPSPARARAVRQKAVHRVIDGIDEGVDEQHQRKLRSSHAQAVNVVDGSVGLEHVDRDGGTEHPDGVIE